MSQQQKHLPNPSVNRVKRPQILANRIKALKKRWPLKVKQANKLVDYQAEYKDLTGAEYHSA